MSQLPEQIKTLLQTNGGSEAAFTEALKLILTTFNSETGTIHKLDTEQQLLHLTAQVGLPPFMLEVVKTIPVGKGIAGATAARGEPVTMCNLQTDTSGIAKSGAKQTGVGGALCVPIRTGDKITGTLGIGTQRPYEYTVEETRLLEEIASILV
ncbi:MAG: GAF domain-containing protein [Verrucomicrobiota bacterium]